MSRPTNVVSPRRSTVTTSPSSTPGVLHHEVAGLERAPVTPYGPRWRATTAAYASRSTGRSPSRATRPRPPPTLTSRIGNPAASSRSRYAGRPDERRLEPVELVAEPAGAGVEVERVDDEPVAARGVDRVVEPVVGDAELGRPVARVGELLRVARPGAGVDADPDRAARRPPPDPLDLADGVEVEPDRVREQDVEVALGDVGAGVADLVGLPAVGEGVQDLAGRAGVDADAAGLAGPPEAAQDREDPRVGVGLEREPDDGTGRRPGRARPGARGRSRRGGRGRRRTAASRARGRGPRGRRR